MLAINVSQLLKEPVGATRSLEAAGDINIIDGASTVSGGVTLVRTDRGILVKGRLKVTVETTCCRCLDVFKCPLDIDIEEEYLPSVDINSGLALEAPDDGESFIVDEHHVLDLTEAIRQYTILAIPMKPLCRQDCAGVETDS